MERSGSEISSCPRDEQRPRSMYAVVVLVLCHIATHRAAASPASKCAFDPSDSGQVQAIDEEGDILLAGGRRIRLANIRFPSLEAAHANEAARSFLASWLVGRSLRFMPLTRHLDRWGRIVAQAHIAQAGFRDASGWIERRLVASGFARVWPRLGALSCLSELMTAESNARGLGVGLWSDALYQIIPATNLVALSRRVGHMTLVQGRIASVGRAYGRVFANFGPDRRRDLALSITNKNLRRFSAEGKTLILKPGEWVLARGIVQEPFGPILEIDNPEQVELRPLVRDDARTAAQRFGKRYGSN